LADFAVARELGTGELADTTVGSGHFKAPEIRANKTYDKSIDIYSYGMTLKECDHVNYREDDECLKQIIEACTKTKPNERWTLEKVRDVMYATKYKNKNKKRSVEYNVYFVTNEKGESKMHSRYGCYGATFQLCLERGLSPQRGFCKKCTNSRGGPKEDTPPG
jgi:serine/threonine protein kinase